MSRPINGVYRVARRSPWTNIPDVVASQVRISVPRCNYCVHHGDVLQLYTCGQQRKIIIGIKLKLLLILLYNVIMFLLCTEALTLCFSNRPVQGHKHAGINVFVNIYRSTLILVQPRYSTGQGWLNLLEILWRFWQFVVSNLG